MFTSRASDLPTQWGPAPGAQASAKLPGPFAPRCSLRPVAAVPGIHAAAAPRAALRLWRCRRRHGTIQQPSGRQCAAAPSSAAVPRAAAGGPQHSPPPARLCQSHPLDRLGRRRRCALRRGAVRCRDMEPALGGRRADVTARHCCNVVSALRTGFDLQPAATNLTCRILLLATPIAHRWRGCRTLTTLVGDRHGGLLSKAAFWHARATRPALLPVSHVGAARCWPPCSDSGCC